MIRKLFTVLLCAALALLVGCAAEVGTAENAATDGGDYTAAITLADGKTSIHGTGAALSGDTLLISRSGRYRLAGTLDGNVTIDCSGEVELVLCGLTVRGEGWALYAKGCDALTLTLAEGGNTLSQSATAEENGVCLESKAPLTIRGDGALTLDAAGIGLRGKADICLTSGTVTVNAADVGVKAKSEGSLNISGGSLTVSAGDDALNAPLVTLSGGAASLAATGRGIDAGELTLSGGTLAVTSGDDGARADTLLTVSGGNVTVEAGCDGLQSQGDMVISGGVLAIHCNEGGGNAIRRFDSGGMGGPGWGSSETTEYYVMPEESCKALKADGGISISGGTLALDSADDTIHAAGLVEISGASIEICTSDDAIHSDTDLIIHSGTILINDCFEGLEAANITINGGDIDIYSVNDGINASSGSGEGFGWGDTAVFTMNGGEVDIYVTGASSNMGDGIDSNGAIYINGGRITAGTDGGTMENGIDSASSFVVTGGILAASGNSGMQESASTYSTQCAAVLRLSSGVDAGTECTVTDEIGNVIMTYTPYRWCSCIVLSHPDFQIGSTYTLTAGDEVKSFTFSSVSYTERGFGGMGGPSF